MSAFIDGNDRAARLEVKSLALFVAPPTHASNLLRAGDICRSLLWLWRNTARLFLSQNTHERRAQNSCPRAAPGR
jgi:hypothetical protein